MIQIETFTLSSLNKLANKKRRRSELNFQNIPQKESPTFEADCAGTYPVDYRWGIDALDGAQRQLSSSSLPVTRSCDNLGFTV